MTEKLEGVNKILRDVHHDVKNNLQVLMSLLSLEARFDNSSKEEVIEKTRGRIMSMALSHEKVYKSNDIAHVDLSDYIETFIKDMDGLNKPNINIDLDLESIEVKLETSIPLGLIINEMLSNVAKHAFPDDKEGNLRVALKSADGNATLIIADDGIGMDESQAAGSLGFTVIQSLTGQLSGNLDMDFTGPGLKYTFDFPINA